MTETVACPRCFRNVAWTDEHWNSAEQCCTSCAPRATVNYGEPSGSNLRRGGIEVRVTGLDVPFGDLVGFTIKFAFASIPAALLLGLFYLALLRLLGYELL